MILQVENNLDKQSQYSSLSTNTTAGGTVLPVKNINSFTASWAAQIGKTGEEQSEVLVLGASTPSGTALNTTGTARFNHTIDTPIYSIHYDKIIFKRSTAGTAGTATALTSGTVTITPDSFYTEFNDSSGVSSYAYKTQYYNSVSGDISSESAWFIPGGPTFYSLQKLRKRTKDALFSAGYLKDDLVIDDWINEWVEDMTNAAIKVNKDYALGTALVAFGTAGYGTITDSDFKQAVKVELSYSGGGYIPSGVKPLSELADTDIYSSVGPIHYWQGDTIFGVKPTGSSGTARITFGKRNPILSNDTDELPLSLRAYTIGCIEWALWRAYGNDQKQELANTHYSVFKEKKTDFVSEITPRDQSSVQMIGLDDELSGREEDSLTDLYF